MRNIYIWGLGASYIRELTVYGRFHLFEPGLWQHSVQCWQKITLLHLGGVIRIIAGVRPHSHTDPLFVHINILKCTDIHRFLVGQLMFCVYSGTLDLFKWYVSFKNDMHNYWYRQTGHYQQSYELGKSSLRYHSTAYKTTLYRLMVLINAVSMCFAHNLNPKLSLVTLQWRYNECDGVSNHRRIDCLLKRCSGVDQRKHQSSAPLAFVRGIHRRPEKSLHKGPVTGENVFHLMTSSWNKKTLKQHLDLLT